MDSISNPLGEVRAASICTFEPILLRLVGFLVGMLGRMLAMKDMLSMLAGMLVLVGILVRMLAGVMVRMLSGILVSMLVWKAGVKRKKKQKNG